MLVFHNLSQLQELFLVNLVTIMLIRMELYFLHQRIFQKRVILIHLPDIFNFESNSLTESVFGKDLMNMINLINENDFLERLFLK